MGRLRSHFVWPLPTFPVRTKDFPASVSHNVRSSNSLFILR
jgi:hypothetical protein